MQTLVSVVAFFMQPGLAHGIGNIALARMIEEQHTRGLLFYTLCHLTP